MFIISFFTVLHPVLIFFLLSQVPMHCVDHQGRPPWPTPRPFHVPQADCRCPSVGADSGCHEPWMDPGDATQAGSLWSITCTILSLGCSGQLQLILKCKITCGIQLETHIANFYILFFHFSISAVRNEYKYIFLLISLFVEMSDDLTTSLKYIYVNWAGLPCGCQFYGVSNNCKTRI